MSDAGEELGAGRASPVARRRVRPRPAFQPPAPITAGSENHDTENHSSDIFSTLLALLLGGLAFVLGEHLFQFSGPVLGLLGHTVGVVRDLVLLDQACGIVAAEGVDGVPAFEGPEAQIHQDTVGELKARMEGIAYDVRDVEVHQRIGVLAVTRAGEDRQMTGPDPASRRAKGKDDTLDAIAAAEAARTKRRVQVAKDRSGAGEALRVLRTTRKTAIKCRRATLQQLHNTIVAAEL